MENELTAIGAPAMAKVSAQVYTDMRNLAQSTFFQKKVDQNSLTSHRNSHR